MLITQTIEIDQPIDEVWSFFDRLPDVAACIPGANLTNEVAKDHYAGDIIIKAGPVKLEFAGSAKVVSRDQVKKIIVIDASGADKKGRGAASAILKGELHGSGRLTKVDISLDMQISGAAAQFGRGLVSDVTAVLVKQTANGMKSRMDAIAKGIDPNSVSTVQSASGLAIGLTAFARAAKRVFARFFLPYKSAPVR